MTDADHCEHGWTWGQCCPKPWPSADRTAFTHGLDLFYDPAVILADANANGIKYEAEKVMGPILRRWFAIDLDPVDAERNAENAAVDLSWHLENVGLLNRPTLIDEEGVEHICDALIEVGPWDEIDGDGTEASIIADCIRDLARLRSAPSLSPTVDDLEAYIDLALIRWVPGDDAGLARHIAESIHPRLVPVSPSVDPEKKP